MAIPQFEYGYLFHKNCSCKTFNVRLTTCICMCVFKHKLFVFMVSIFVLGQVSFLTTAHCHFWSEGFPAPPPDTASHSYSVVSPRELTNQSDISL